MRRPEKSSLTSYYSEMVTYDLMDKEQEVTLMRHLGCVEADIVRHFLAGPGSFVSWAYGELTKCLLRDDDSIGVIRLAEAARSNPKRIDSMIKPVLMKEGGRKWMDKAHKRAQKLSEDRDSWAEHRAGQYVRTLNSLWREALTIKNKFVVANLRLVVKLAHQQAKFSPLHSMEDLVQEGNLGLIRAVEKFDVERGFRFSTYSAWWIRHYINRYIDDKESVIKVPVYVRERVRKITKFTRQYSSVHGEYPTESEIVKAVGLDKDQVHAMLMEYGKRVYSLDNQINTPDGTGDLWVDILRCVKPDAEENVDTAREAHYAQQLLDVLTPFESMVIKSRFGIGTDEATLKEIGDKYNLTRERIRQIERAALKRIRDKISHSNDGVVNRHHMAPVRMLRPVKDRIQRVAIS